MDINQTIVIGRLTRDPELSYTRDQKAIAKFSIASDDMPSAAGEKRVNFFDITAFGKTADTVGKYLRKGLRVGIVGRLRHETWKSNEGKNMSRIVIIVGTVQFLTPKDGSQATPQGVTPGRGGDEEDFRDFDDDGQGG